MKPKNLPFRLSVVSIAFGIVLALALAARLSGQQPLKHRVGLPQDWTHQHLIFSNLVSYQQVATNLPAYSRWLNILYDTRFILQREKRTATVNLTAALAAANDPKDPKHPKPPKVSLTRDWSVSLGASVASAMDPAKYTYDVNATPNCTNDYAVYPVNHAASGTQANLVGFNNLYSASTGTNYCTTGPSVIFAYESGSGAIETSPTLSLDGTQVAFVESASSAVFHVLKIATSSSNNLTFFGGGTIASPAVPGTGNSAVDQKVTISGSVAVTLSSPFVDYDDDIAYVGDNNGKLHKFTPVFSGTPAEITSAPWPVAVAPAGTILTGPIYDSVSGNVFVGGSDGNLYAVSASTGAVRAAVISGRDSSVACQNIVDPPIVDSTNGTIFTQANASALGANCTGDGVVVQLDTTTPTVSTTWTASHGYTFSATTPVLITDGTTNCGGSACIEWLATSGTSGSSHPTWSTTVGGVTTDSTAYWVNVGKNQLNLRASIVQGTSETAVAHSGAFDNTYFNDSGKGGNYYYVLGSTETLKNGTFSSGGVMSAGSVSVDVGNGTSGLPSPLTEIYNPTANGVGAADWLFLGITASAIAKGGCGVSNACILSFNITTSGSPVATQGATETGGTSGIIIDNVFSEPLWQASHAYAASSTTLITDSNGNVEECTTSGTSGSTHPTWMTTVGAVTTDNTAKWTNEGPNQTSSAYFGALSGTNAVKLTQSGLQ